MAWRCVPQRQRLHAIEPSAFLHQIDFAEGPLLVALTQSVRQDPAMRPVLACLEMRDPRQVQAISVLRLFEQHQERLPPVLMAGTVSRSMICSGGNVQCAGTAEACG